MLGAAKIVLHGLAELISKSEENLVFVIDRV
jgi:hypothetical protein